MRTVHAFVTRTHSVSVDVGVLFRHSLPLKIDFFYKTLHSEKALTTDMIIVEMFGRSSEAGKSSENGGQ